MRFRRIAEVLEWVGIAGLFLMFIFTVIDVVGSKVFSKPLPGAFEWIGYLQIIAIGGTLAIGFYVNRHIAFEFLVWHLPAPVKKAVNIFVSLLCFVFFIVLARESFRYGLSLQKAGEISSTAHLPLYPFAFFLAFAAVVTALFFADQILPEKSPSSRERREPLDESR